MSQQIIGMHRFMTTWRPALRDLLHSRWTAGTLESMLISSLSRSFRCVELEGHIDAHYYRTEVCVTARKRTEPIPELVRVFSAMLDKRDVDYRLDSGTLLGKLRAQSVIPWNDDADF
ncbi:hypothetical protein PInf_018424 [Phytophthora infestans]|nr:hypothetical protein PInf_018424 [Phytophthora infestans]